MVGSLEGIVRFECMPRRAASCCKGLVFNGL